MKLSVVVFVLLNLSVSLTVGQFYGSGFYQGSYQAAGFSPFAFQQNPFIGGGLYDNTHVHYHVPAGRYRGGGYYGGGGLGLGIGTRDIASGAVGFLLGSVLNRNNGRK